MNSNVTSDQAPGHARSGELAVIDRRIPLPPVCVLSGREAKKRITCLFHWRETVLNAGGGGFEALVSILFFYLLDVPKAVLRLPLSNVLVFRRKIGFVLVLMLIIASIATISGITISQQRINAMPEGPDRKLLNDWLVPGIAVGGFAVMMIFFWASHVLTPTITPLD
jgi:hypothetical protein